MGSRRSRRGRMSRFVHRNHSPFDFHMTNTMRYPLSRQRKSTSSRNSPGSSRRPSRNFKIFSGKRSRNRRPQCQPPEPL